MRKQKSPIGIVVVNTKSNFRNLNYVDLPLVEICGTRVTALLFNDSIGILQLVDFHLSEVINIYTKRIDIDYAKDLIKKNLESAI